MFKEIFHLILKDYKIELRQKNVLMGIVLYVFSSVFMIYITFKEGICDNKTWIGLLWIIILFSVVSTIGTGFAKERKELRFYLCTLVNIEAIVFGKMIYNIILMLIVGIVCYTFYIVLTGNIVNNIIIFGITFLLGITGLASIFTLVNAIAINADNNFTLSAILGIPLIIPMLILIIKLSEYSLLAEYNTEIFKYFLLLFALNLIIAGLTYLLAKFIKG
ncbi:MAG: heme exporter protein CcmB [Bacteroidota bacterium]|nr:heme exporter protein CcmB [Bacteroidota bacterium]